MSVNENAVALRFADRATAYQALSELKHLSPATTEVRAAVLIERLEDGAVRVPEGMDGHEGRNTAVGGLVGSLVGILGGPLGVLMGWGVGALIGEAMTTSAPNGAPLPSASSPSRSLRVARPSWPRSGSPTPRLWTTWPCATTPSSSAARPTPCATS